MRLGNRTYRPGNKTNPVNLVLERPVAEVIRHYKNRLQIETAFRDAKQHFGFDTYQLRDRKSLNRFVQHNFVAASLTQLIFTNTATDTTSV